MLDITRNQYFLAGLILLALGAQFRMTYSVTLTPEFTQMLAERTGHPAAAVGAVAATSTGTVKPAIQKTFQPPEWLGWALLSAGSVLVLHSMAMRKPE